MKGKFGKDGKGLMLEGKEEERIKKLWLYILSLLDYRDSVVERIKDVEEWPIKFPIGTLESKQSFIKWLEEDDLNFEILKDYPQVLATKLPNEIVLEMDIEDPKKRKIYYKSLENTLIRLGIDKYLAIFTGNKSIHYHLFVKPDNLTLKDFEKIRNSLVKYLSIIFPIDTHSVSLTTGVRLPFSIHPSTKKEVRIIKPEIHDKPINFFAERLPEIFKSLELFPPIFKRFLEIEERKSYANQKIVKIPQKGKLSKLYEEILNTKWRDGRKRLLGLLFALAKKIDIPREDFEKSMREWIERQYNRLYSQAYSILKCYLRHWDQYNWSWRGFLKRHLLDSTDFADREKLENILNKLGINLEFKKIKLSSKSVRPPDLEKATKWMKRDAKREEILEMEVGKGKIVFYVLGVMKKITHKVVYRNGGWYCNCRGFKKNKICSHIICAWNYLLSQHKT